MKKRLFMEIFGYVGVLPHENNLAEQRKVVQKHSVKRIITEPTDQVRRGRQAFFELLKEMKPGDSICVKSLDRLAMSFAQLCDTLLELHAKGFNIVAIDEGLNSAEPVNLYDVVTNIVEFDRNIDASNEAAGIARSARRGKSGGRPVLLNTEDIERARKMLIDGDLTIAEIAEEMGVSVATLYRYFPGGKGRLS